MFIGRTKELNIINQNLLVPNKHIIIYGNRRVGKTTLANTAAINSKLEFISFECLKSSLKDNVDGLIKALLYAKIITSTFAFNSLIDLFHYLNSLNRHIVIIIDEYPYLYVKNNKDEVDSIFQTILDKYSSNLNIIISGSHIGMMKTLIKKGNPLFGRFNTIIPLKELDYYEASLFCPNLSNYDKASFYSVFGGSPFILRQLDYTKSLEENIKNTFLNNTSSINLFVSENYTSDITTKTAANRIFEILSNSKEKHNRIEELLGYEHNGLLSKQLELLMDMEFIERNEPINKIGDKKKATYFIKNNALRFYFTFVYGKSNTLSLIGSDAFFNNYIKEKLTTFIALRFEDISKSFISILTQKGKLKDIYNIGTYYYDDSKTKTNGEFDVAIQRKDGFDIIEVKFLKNKVNQTIINEEIKQIKQISEIKIKDYGFISINGFDSGVTKMKYMFTGDDLYFKDESYVQKIKEGEKEDFADMPSYDSRKEW